MPFKRKWHMLFLDSAKLSQVLLFLILNFNNLMFQRLLKVLAVIGQRCIDNLQAYDKTIRDSTVFQAFTDI